MLIAFKVGNFRSYADEQELSYVAWTDRTHDATHIHRTGVRSMPRLVRAAVLFGPNAGGKSNLMLALATFRALVLGSSTLTDAQYAELHQPFGWGPASARPTRFTVDLLIDTVRHRYVVAYDARRIVHEELLVYRTGKAQRWFLRSHEDSAQTESWAAFSPNFTGPREMWRKATRPRALFLTTAVSLGSELLRPLYDWFEKGFAILRPADAPLASIADHIQDARLKTQMLRVLEAADIPIADIRVAAPDGDGLGRARADLRARLEFLPAKDATTWLDGADLSAGTIRLLRILAAIQGAISEGRLAVIDEFGAGLHPILSKFLVDLAHRPGTVGQLLLAAHCAALMDLNLLRRDEIWLVELDGERASQLVPLTRHKPRKREMIVRSYLRGRYGAVPRMALEEEEWTGPEGAA
jgi:uncharacterized protein